MMSTVPSCRPWLISLTLPRLDAGKTWISYLPLVRFLNSSPAQTDHLWYGSEVSYTCAHFSLVWACTGAAAAAASAQAAISFRVRRLLMASSPRGGLLWRQEWLARRQLALYRLVAFFRCCCMASRAACASRARIASSTAPCSTSAALHDAGFSK